MNRRSLITILVLGSTTGCATMASTGPAPAHADAHVTDGPVAAGQHVRPAAVLQDDEAPPGRRWQFGVAAGAGAGAGLGAVADSLSAQGYTSQSRTGETTGMVRAWARAELTPRIFGKLTYDFRFRTRINTSNPTATSPSTADFNARQYTIALTGEIPIGPVWIEAGPALKFVGAEYEERVEVGSSVLAESSTETVVQVGGVIRSSFRYPVLPEMNVLGSVGYGLFPDAEGDQTVTAPVGVSGWSLMLGLEWAP